MMWVDSPNDFPGQVVCVPEKLARGILLKIEPGRKRKGFQVEKNTILLNLPRNIWNDNLIF
jgi:hypothetical protein